MLKRLSTLEAQFWLMIAVGCVVFFLVPLWFRISSCPALQSERMNHDENDGPVDNGEKPENYQYGTTYIADGISNAPAVVVQKHQAESDKEPTSASDKDIVRLLSDLLCDAHFTDIALVYFTYCLVIVGLFTLRSGERTSRDLERARLSGGPLPGTIAIFPNDITKFVIGVTNTGRTTATIRNIVVGTSNTEPISAIPNYSEATHKKAFNHNVKADGVFEDPHWLIEHNGTGLFYCFDMPNISTFSVEDKLAAFVQALIRKLGNSIQLATPLGMKTIKSNKRTAPAYRIHLNHGLGRSSSQGYSPEVLKDRGP